MVAVNEPVAASSGTSASTTRRLAVFRVPATASERSRYDTLTASRPPSGIATVPVPEADSTTSSEEPSSPGEIVNRRAALLRFATVQVAVKVAPGFSVRSAGPATAGAATTRRVVTGTDAAARYAGAITSRADSVAERFVPAVLGDASRNVASTLREAPGSSRSRPAPTTDTIARDGSSDLGASSISRAPLLRLRTVHRIETVPPGSTSRGPGPASSGASSTAAAVTANRPLPERASSPASTASSATAEARPAAAPAATEDSTGTSTDSPAPTTIPDGCAGAGTSPASLDTTVNRYSRATAPGFVTRNVCRTAPPGITTRSPGSATTGARTTGPAGGVGGVATAVVSGSAVPGPSGMIGRSSESGDAPPKHWR